MKSYPETINKMPSQEKEEKFIKNLINEYIENFNDAKKKQVYEALSLLVIGTGTDIEELKTHLRNLNLMTLHGVMTNPLHKQAIINYIAKTAQNDFKYDLETKISSFSIRQLLGYGYWLKLNCKGVTSIYLSSSLHELTPEQWTAFFAGLKESSVTALDLSRKHVVETPAQWTAFLAALKESPVTSIDLNCHSLHELTPAQWTAFLTGLKESPVTSLNLSKNNLHELTPAQWTAFLAALEKSPVTSLDLSKSNLYNLTPEQWTAFFAALKKSSVTSLNLSDNQLGELSTEQWTAFLEGIRNSPLTTIDLKNNEFSEERKIPLRPLLMCHNEESKRFPSLKTLTTLFVFGDPKRRAEAFKICGKELATSFEQPLVAVNNMLHTNYPRNLTKRT